MDYIMDLMDLILKLIKLIKEITTLVKNIKKRSNKVPATAKKRDFVTPKIIK